MLESDWLTIVLRSAIIFREMHGERSSKQLSWPHYSSVSLRLMISVISKVFQQKKKHNDTGQTNKHSKQKDKSTDLVHVFATKLRFIMYGKHIAYSLSPSQTHI